MVKKSSKKTPTKPSIIKKLILYPWWVKILTLTTLIILAITLCNVYQQWQLERRFVILDKDVSTLLDGDKIVYEKEKYCFHESVKFGGGALKCKLDIDLIKNIDSSVDKVQQTISKHEDNWKIKRFTGEVSRLDIFQATNTKANVACEMVVIRNKESIATEANFYCSEKSKRAFYPYRD